LPILSICDPRSPPETNPLGKLRALLLAASELDRAERKNPPYSPRKVGYRRRGDRSSLGGISRAAEAAIATGTHEQ
jgi:hypothetical protein